MSKKFKVRDILRIIENVDEETQTGVITELGLSKKNFLRKNDILAIIDYTIARIELPSLIWKIPFVGGLIKDIFSIWRTMFEKVLTIFSNAESGTTLDLLEIVGTALDFKDRDIKSLYTEEQYNELQERIENRDLYIADLEAIAKENISDLEQCEKDRSGLRNTIAVLKEEIERLKNEIEDLKAAGADDKIPEIKKRVLTEASSLEYWHSEDKKQYGGTDQASTWVVSQYWPALDKIINELRNIGG